MPELTIIAIVAMLGMVAIVALALKGNLRWSVKDDGINMEVQQPKDDSQ